MLAIAAGASLTGALLRRRVGGTVGEAAAAALSLAPAVLALRGGELAAYHGVEHKAIAAYESPDDQDAADAAKEHDRCGSHLVTPLLASNLAGALLVRQRARAPRPGRRRRRGASRRPRPRSRSSPGASATPARRSPARCAAPASSSSALLGTREPDERQLEVGRAALAEILRVEPSAAPFRVQTLVRLRGRPGHTVAAMRARTPPCMLSLLGPRSRPAS